MSNRMMPVTINAKQADRKASIKAKFPNVFQGLGKLKGYQLKLHSLCA